MNLIDLYISNEQKYMNTVLNQLQYSQCRDNRHVYIVDCRNVNIINMTTFIEQNLPKIKQALCIKYNQDLQVTIYRTQDKNSNIRAITMPKIIIKGYIGEPYDLEGDTLKWRMF